MPHAGGIVPMQCSDGQDVRVGMHCSRWEGTTPAYPHCAAMPGVHLCSTPGAACTVSGP